MGATITCRPERCASFPSLGGTSLALVPFAPQRTRAAAEAGGGAPSALPPGVELRRRQDLRSSWGTGASRLHVFQTDAGRTANARPNAVQQYSPDRRKAKASTDVAFGALAA